MNLAKVQSTDINYPVGAENLRVKRRDCYLQ